MKPFMSTFAVAVVCTVLIPFQVDAEHWTPLQVSLWGRTAVPPSDWDVYGIRINPFYGNSTNVWGIDIGTVNRSDNFRGIQVAILGNIPMDCSGVQISPFVNATRDLRGVQLAIGLFGFNQAQSMSGLQINGGLFGNHASSVKGMQIALLSGNYAAKQKGFQLALFKNKVYHQMVGGQVALLYNRAESVHGFQIGILNSCDDLVGLQVGILNIVKTSTVPFFPAINVRF